MQRHPFDQPLATPSLLDVPELRALPTAEPPAAAPSRVLVVATDPVVSAAFRQRLGRCAVGQAEPHNVAAETKRLSADVVLWDLGPGEVRAEALSVVPVPVVVLTSAVGSAAELLAAGASGVLGRHASAEATMAAVATVRIGLQVVDPSLAGGGAFGRVRGDSTAQALTAREVQVLELVATGMSNKQVATELRISAHTVKFHVNAILGKLDVHTRTQAVVRGVQLGFIRV